MIATGIETIEPPRRPTEWERQILARLLGQKFAGRDELRLQAETALVRGRCSCGCPSIFYDVPRVPDVRAIVTDHVPVEAQAADVDGMKIHFLLRIVDGYLFELDIHREDSGRIHRLPDPNSLEVF